MSRSTGVAYRFTPRRKNSKWSPLNLRLAERLIAEGEMTPACRAAYERRKHYNEAVLDALRSDRVSLPPEIETALRSNETAWANFQALAPGYRRQYAAWLIQAVKPETQNRRLKEALRLLEENRKLGMK